MKITVQACFIAFALSVVTAFLDPADGYAQQWATTYYEAAAPNGQMTVSDIPWSKYTHITHFAISTTGKGDVILNYLTQDNINAFIKSKPSGKKALVTTIDNYNDFTLFPKSASPANLDTFVASMVDFVVANGYDGIDLDWEKNVDVTQYIALIRKLRNSSGMKGKVIAIAANPVHVPIIAANIDAIDQVNVMCYDFDWDSTFAWYVGTSSKREPECVRLRLENGLLHQSRHSAGQVGFRNAFLWTEVVRSDKGLRSGDVQCGCLYLLQRFGQRQVDMAAEISVL